MKKEEYTEHELINLIKQKDEDAFVIMRKKYDRLIYHLAHELRQMYPYVYCSFDDLVQEGTIALYKALTTYNPDIQVKFVTYAYKVIRRRMKVYINRQSDSYANEYSYENMAVQESVSGYKDGSYHLNPSTIYFGKYEQELLIQAYMDLPVLQRKILKYKLQGKTYVEISKLCDINVKKVDNQLRNIKEKLLKKINNYDVIK